MLQTYLVLMLASLAVVEAYVAQIDCSGKRGQKTTTESWDCDYDGSATCSIVVEDCTGTGDGSQGQESGGTANYDQNGRGVSAVGADPDCSNQCQNNPGQSGSKTKKSFESSGSTGRRSGGSRRQPSNG